MLPAEPGQYRGAAIVFAVVPVLGFGLVCLVTWVLWGYASDNGDGREWIGQLGLLTLGSALGLVSAVALVYVVAKGRVRSATVALGCHAVAAAIVVLVGLDASVHSDGLILGFVVVVEFCAVMALVNCIRDANEAASDRSRGA